RHCQGQETDIDFRIITQGGVIRWIRDQSYPVFNADGKVERIVGTARDITERKAARQHIVEQAQLLDKAHDAIVVRDLNHHVTYWNKSAERLYGWSAEEILGRAVENLLYRDPAEFIQAFELLLEDNEWSGEFQQISKSGAEITVEARWTLVRDDNGQPKAVLAIHTDITEQKRMEGQFLRAQRMESIGTLAGGIAHDLNNVLAPIMMSIDLLKLSTRGGSDLAILSTIELSARRGAEMVQQVLSFARGVEGRRLVIDPAEVVRDVQHLIHETFPKSIEFHAHAAAAVPAFMGDPTQVHQVLINLCVNARDAMPEGGRIDLFTATVRLDSQDAALNPNAKTGPYVVIKVADNGSGIPKEIRDKIFDPFFTTKELGKGTGLGLSTVLAIVKSHGGFINVDSEPGRGTAFTVYFPAHARTDDTRNPLMQEMHPRGNGEVVLVVDDEESVRSITRRTLEAFGYNVITACDGAEAVALYAEHRDTIEVVLTDMMMPVMDGPAAIRILTRMNPDVRIIAASGLNLNGGGALVADMAVKHFLPKPYTAQTLLLALKELRNLDLPHAALP
ncbi:MAG: PAS domain S-box protein, partial [Prosthecobacter sp.]|nr:PAS domain S-box protein [Prosthecobacter sp.]